MYSKMATIISSSFLGAGLWRAESAVWSIWAATASSEDKKKEYRESEQTLGLNPALLKQWGNFIFNFYTNLLNPYGSHLATFNVIYTKSKIGLINTAKQLRILNSHVFVFFKK